MRRSLLSLLVLLCACATDPDRVVLPGGGKADSPAAHDELLVMFGGQDYHGACLDDTLVWNGAGWDSLDVSGPSPRSRAVLAALGDRLVLFGGWSNAVVSQGEKYADTWTFDGAKWKLLDVSGPSARSGAVMATLGDTLVLFGGLSAANKYLSDTWIFDGDTWTKLAIDGPDPRNFAAMESLGDQLVLTGGKRGATVYGDTWLFDGRSWSRLDEPGPPARSSASLAQLGTELVLFGGYLPTAPGSASLASDTWVFDGESWTEMDTAPSPVERASAGLARRGDELVLFGGYGPKFTLDDTWVWDGASWSEVDVAAPPTERTRPAIATLPLAD